MGAKTKLKPGFANVETRAELAEQRLRIAMDALHDIAAIPRAGRAARLARAVVRFIEETPPSSISVSREAKTSAQDPKP